MEGVAALHVHDGSLVGFMLGAAELGSPAGTWAGMMRPRSAEIPYDGFAADRDDSKLYRSCMPPLPLGGPVRG
jgi:hypothetical protein